MQFSKTRSDITAYNQTLSTIPSQKLNTTLFPQDTSINPSLTSYTKKSRFLYMTTSTPKIQKELKFPSPECSYEE